MDATQNNAIRIVKQLGTILSSDPSNASDYSLNKKDIFLDLFIF